MDNEENQESISEQQEEFPIVLESKTGITVIFIFLTILLIEFLGFLVIRNQIALSAGEMLYIIDLPSVLVLVIGALMITYLYISRYVRRVITIDKEKFSLKVGRRLFEYEWEEFAIVALSVAVSNMGIKGFSIRIYESDLEGEYVELPIYRLPKTIDVFNLRSRIEELIESSKNQLSKTTS